MKSPLKKQRRRRKFRRQEKSVFNLPMFWAGGWWTYLQRSREIASAERYCMFIGYPRSGHSLVGSLLNAHPEIVIAHEVNLLRYLRRGFPRSVLLGLLLRRDEQFGGLGREWSGYDYTVPDQYQGRFTELHVIGDKRGRASTKILGREPHLMGALRSHMNMPLRVIHHVRNPFDNIATMARRGHDSLEVAADRYFRFAGWASTALQTLGPGERLDTYHEDFVADPPAELRRLTEFLGVEASIGYLDSCAAVVFPSPSRSRDRVEWPPGLVASIQQRMQDFPYLHRYTFAD